MGLSPLSPAGLEACSQPEVRVPWLLLPSWLTDPHPSELISSVTDPGKGPSPARSPGRPPSPAHSPGEPAPPRPLSEDTPGPAHCAERRPAPPTLPSSTLSPGRRPALPLIIQGDALSPAHSPGLTHVPLPTVTAPGPALYLSLNNVLWHFCAPGPRVTGAHSLGLLFQWVSGWGAQVLSAH